jgi:hypothetical protein
MASAKIEDSEVPFWYRPKEQWINSETFNQALSRFDSEDPAFHLIPQVQDSELEDLMYKSYAPKEEISREDHESARRKLQQRLKELKNRRRNYNNEKELKK